MINRKTAVLLMMCIGAVISLPTGAADRGLTAPVGETTEAAAKTEMVVPHRAPAGTAVQKKYKDCTYGDRGQVTNAPCTGTLADDKGVTWLP